MWRSPDDPYNRGIARGADSTPRKEAMNTTEAHEAIAAGIEDLEEVDAIIERIGIARIEAFDGTPDEFWAMVNEAL